MSVAKSIKFLLDNNAAVTAIVGDKVYPIKIPQIRNFPALTYHEVLNVPTDEKGAVSGFERIDYDIICWSRSYAQVTDLADKVRTALDRVAISSQGSTIDTIVFVSSIDNYDNGAEMYQKNIQFKFIVIR